MSLAQPLACGSWVEYRNAGISGRGRRKRRKPTTKMQPETGTQQHQQQQHHPHHPIKATAFGKTTFPHTSSNNNTCMSSSKDRKNTCNNSSNNNSGATSRVWRKRWLARPFFYQQTNMCYVGTTSANGYMSRQPPPGQHRLILIIALGRDNLGCRVNIGSIRKIIPRSRLSAL